MSFLVSLLYLYDIYKHFVTKLCYNDLYKLFKGEDVMSRSQTNDTFIVQIAYQQNDTWQGTLKWMNQGKEAHFRSTLELIHMIDTAIKADHTGTDSGLD